MSDEKRKEQAKAYRATNREEIAAKHRAYHEAHKEDKTCTAAHKAHVKAYRAANKEAIAARQRAYYRKTKKAA